METILMNWDAALRLLRDREATGKGSTSSFKGVLNDGSKVSLADSSGAYSYGGKVTGAGSIVAQELKRIGANRRPASNDNSPFCAPPRFAIPGYYGECVYLDIRSAYHSIYTRIQWDKVFLPARRRVGRGDIELSEIDLQSKRAKVALVGMAISKSAFMWNRGIPSKYTRVSGFYNPQLVWYIWGVLSAIARRARKAGAVYWNTDGAIVRAKDAAKVARVIKNAGLNLSIKAYGKGIVFGIGAYSIGGMGTPRKFDTPKFYLSEVMSSEIAYNDFIK